MFALLLLSLVSLSTCLQSGIERSGVLLKDWPVLLTHNAGTGYFDSSGSNLRTTDSTYASYPSQLILKVSQNQKEGFLEQLACGARALNVRPAVYQDRLVMHHGSVVVNHNLSLAMDDVLSFVASNPTELILLVFSDCTGTNCWTRTMDLLYDKGIYLHKEDSMGQLNVTEAKRLGKIATGGSVVGVPQSAWQQNYNPGNTENFARCYPDYQGKFTGRRLQKKGSCLEQADLPMTLLRNQVTTLANQVETELAAQNGHWQYTADDIEGTILSQSSLINDNSESEANRFVANLIQNLVHVNLLQVDNVCDGGQELFAQLQAYSGNKNLSDYQIVPTGSPTTTTDAPNSAATFCTMLFYYAILVQCI